MVIIKVIIKVKIKRSGFRNYGSESRVQGSGFRAQSSGFRVQYSGFRVQGSELIDLG
jgi:hypothetical protein